MNARTCARRSANSSGMATVAMDSNDRTDA
jgi:hypothetical protein